MWRRSDHDKFAPRNLSCTTLSDSVIKIISSSQFSPNTDPFPCHLASLVCNIPATILWPCQLPEPEQIMSPHYSAGWSQIHSPHQMENLQSFPKDEDKAIHPYMSTRDCDSSLHNRVKCTLCLCACVCALLKLFIVQGQVWLNRYNSMRRLSCKSSKLILRAFSDTRSWGSGT